MCEAYQGSRSDAPVTPIVVSMVREEWVEALDVRVHEEAQGKDNSRLLAVGRLSGEKGFDVLLRAVRDLVSSGRQVTLDIVGAGSEQEALERLIQELDLSNSVFLRGYVPFGEELLSYYRRADIFVLPSRSGEGVPQVLLEAMASGTPVVASAVEGVPYIINDGDNGLLVPPDDPGLLAGRLREVMDDRRLAKHLAIEGRTFVSAHTLERECEHIIATLERYWPQRLRTLEQSSNGLV